jgi:uncharacterized protein (DUF1778 family)
VEKIMPDASAHAPRTRATRTGTINIRVQPADRALIDQAAESQGKNRSDFMLEAARRAAREALLDRTLFRVDAETYDRFVAMLDSPAQPNERLRELLLTRAPWD